MPVRKVRIYGDAVLKKRCKPVSIVTEEERQILEDMVQTMLAFRGVGLAAPQIGISKRLIVVHTGENGIMKLINPRILKKRGSMMGKEGCLSFPGIFADIRRAKEVLVEALNENGMKLKMNAIGIVARIIQHEIDHLDGILINQRMSILDRIKLGGALRKLKRLQASSLS